MSNDLGIDRSGNGNDWAVTNITYADQVVDSPTNNFCTMNPIAKTGTITLSEGNLKAAGGAGTTGIVGGSFAPVHSGKWYFEHCVTDATHKTRIGWRKQSSAQVADNLGFMWNTQGDTSWSYAFADEADEDEDEGDASVGDVIGHALDLDSGTNTLKFYKNNVLAATYTASNASDGYVPAFFDFSGSGSNTSAGTFNFGQDSSFAGAKTAQGNQDSNDIGDFYYEPPTDYLALCTSNLPEPAVVPSEHFNTVEWSGTGSTNARTGIGFQPDYVWIKETTTAAIASHCSFDVLRGVNEALGTDDHGGQANDSGAGDLLTSFDSDGFTLGANGGGKSINRSSDTYVAWNWKAGGSGSANTDGDMAETVTVSANTDAGFSIVTYTGDGSAATVGHGLSKAPDMIVIKGYAVDNNEHWRVYHSSNTGAPETDYLVQDEVDATADDATVWNDTAPTATVFSLGTMDAVNEDDEPFVAYCFHSVEGYSKFGTYEGNGADDGTFVYTGFSPAWVMVKSEDATSTYTSWAIYDSERKTLNSDTGLDSNPLYANKTAGEGERGNNTTDISSNAMAVDFLSNGFKFRDNADEVNAANAYVYAAFAETPFKYSNAK